jgi:hypothetical protein
MLSKVKLRLLLPASADQRSGFMECLLKSVFAFQPQKKAEPVIDSAFE